MLRYSYCKCVNRTKSTQNKVQCLFGEFHQLQFHLFVLLFVMCSLNIIIISMTISVHVNMEHYQIVDTNGVKGTL